MYSTRYCLSSVCRYLNVNLALFSLFLLNCTLCCCFLLVGTYLCTLLSMVCLSVLNRTHCRLWFFCRYWTVDFVAYHLSFRTKLYILLSSVSLSLLNYIYFCLRSVCRYWILHIAVCGLCHYWTVRISVCGLSVGTEHNTMLCAVCLLVLNFLDCFVRSLFRYWTVQIALCGLSFGTEL